MLATVPKHFGELLTGETVFCPGGLVAFNGLPRNKFGTPFSRSYPFLVLRKCYRIRVCVRCRLSLRFILPIPKPLNRSRRYHTVATKTGDDT